MFNVGNSSGAQAAANRLLDELEPAAWDICPSYGLDPAVCIDSALRASAGGRHVICHNYWELTGTGRGGFYQSIVPVQTGRADGGGWSAAVNQVARFGSPKEAVDAWCRAQLAAR